MNAIYSLIGKSLLQHVHVHHVQKKSYTLPNVDIKTRNRKISDLLLAYKFRY